MATTLEPEQTVALDSYPHLDAVTLLTEPPAARPFIVVTDTDELIREIAHRARTGNEPVLLSIAKLGWARVFATDRVADEVARNLPCGVRKFEPPELQRVCRIRIKAPHNPTRR